MQLFLRVSQYYILRGNVPFPRAGTYAVYILRMPFELHNIHPNMAGSAIADKRLNPDSSLVRGCGGIGIIWNKKLKAVPIAGIDSDRICAISIASTTCSIH